MTEQKELYQDGKLIGYCSSIITSFDRYTITDFKAIKELSESDQAFNFKVGEYYTDTKMGMVYRIEKINGSCETIDVTLLTKERVIITDLFFGFDLTGDRPATAEEIALFKRAEHFHSKGRKLNEFKMDDILKNECDMYYFYSYRDMNDGGLYNSDDCLIGEVKDCDLIMTAEELEVAAMEGKG